MMSDARGSGDGGGAPPRYKPAGASKDDEDRYLEALRSLGTPEQLAAKLQAIDELIEEKKKRDWLFVAVRTIATWAAAVAAGWLAFKGVLTDFLLGIKK